MKRPLMGVEGRDFFEQRRVVGGRRRLGAAKPAKGQVVVGVEQRLELRQFLGVQRLDARIDETAEDKVHFAHSTPPGADANAASSNFERVQSFSLGVCVGVVAGHWICVACGGEAR